MKTIRSVLLCTLAVSSGLFCETTFAGSLKDEFYQDFRSPTYPPSRVLGIATGDGEHTSIQRDAGGLRIRVSGKESGFPPYGVSPRFRVNGDFEITASYEVIKLDKPTAGYGVSVALWVMVDLPSVDAVCVSRSHRPWDGNVWVADKGWWDKSEKKYHHDGQSFPTECRTGKLRLVRKGSTIQFLVAEGDTDEFQELRQIDYSSEDLSQIHLGVDTGGSKGPTEILLKDLRIRADELPLSGVTKKQTSWAWLVWLGSGVLGAGVLACGAFCWWYTARRRSVQE
jgi:Protein of unknown function (DUF1583)